MFFAIPPRYEVPKNFKLIGNLLGGYIDYDKTEFKKGVVCILFSQDISKLVLMERFVFLEEGAEPLLQFSYDHLKSRCSLCGLVTHVGARCEEPHLVDQTRAMDLGFAGSSSRNPNPNFSFPAKASSDSLLQPIGLVPLLLKRRNQLS